MSYHGKQVDTTTFSDIQKLNYWKDSKQMVIFTSSPAKTKSLIALLDI